ncbi:MAG: hypothetical protein JWM85_3082 [Acidimicrobiaceae bacterium]|nr:hypothetical protein [Acidimicrobiaceae bacterium]
MSEQPGGDRIRSPRGPGWWWSHAGRLSGAVLGLLVFAGLVLLAFAGYTPAILLIILVVVFLAFIIIGGRIRGM